MMESNAYQNSKMIDFILSLPNKEWNVTAVIIISVILQDQADLKLV